MYFRPYFLHEMSSSPSIIVRDFPFAATSAVSVSRRGLLVSPVASSPCSVSDPAPADPASPRDPSPCSPVFSFAVPSPASLVRSLSVDRRKRDTARTMSAAFPPCPSGRPRDRATRSTSSETSSSTADIAARSFRSRRVPISRAPPPSWSPRGTASEVSKTLKRPFSSRK